MYQFSDPYTGFAKLSPLEVEGLSELLTNDLMESMQYSGAGSLASLSSNTNETVNEAKNAIKVMEARLVYLENILQNISSGGRPVVTNSIQPNTHYSSQSHPIPSIKLSSLDSLLIPEFALNPHPDPKTLNRLFLRLEQHYHQHQQGPRTRRHIIALLRKWFRRRRDENGQRVFAACQAIVMPLVAYGLGEEELKIKIQENEDGLLQRIMAECDLDVTESYAARQFFLEKIDAFFLRRIIKGKSKSRM